MRLFYTDRFLKSLRDAPASVQKAFHKQGRVLLQYVRHRSLRAKKYDEANDTWQARVAKGWGFYFTIRGDLYYLIYIIPHPK